MNDVDRAVLRDQLLRCVEELDLTLEATKDRLDREEPWRVADRPLSVYAMVTPNGEPVLAPMLAAKAQLLAALVDLDSSAQLPAALVDLVAALVDRTDPP